MFFQRNHRQVFRYVYRSSSFIDDTTDYFPSTENASSTLPGFYDAVQAAGNLEFAIFSSVIQR